MWHVFYWWNIEWSRKSETEYLDSFWGLSLSLVHLVLCIGHIGHLGLCLRHLGHLGHLGLSHVSYDWFYSTFKKIQKNWVVLEIL